MRQLRQHSPQNGSDELPTQCCGSAILYLELALHFATIQARDVTSMVFTANRTLDVRFHAAAGAGHDLVSQLAVARMGAWMRHCSNYTGATISSAPSSTPRFAIFPQQDAVTCGCDCNGHPAHDTSRRGESESCCRGTLPTQSLLPPSCLPLLFTSTHNITMTSTSTRFNVAALLPLQVAPDQLLLRCVQPQVLGASISGGSSVSIPPPHSTASSSASAAHAKRSPASKERAPSTPTRSALARSAVGSRSASADARHRTAASSLGGEWESAEQRVHRTLAQRCWQTAVAFIVL
jgi:hypothetical protein